MVNASVRRIDGRSVSNRPYFPSGFEVVISPADSRSVFPQQPGLKFAAIPSRVENVIPSEPEGCYFPSGGVCGWFVPQQPGLEFAAIPNRVENVIPQQV